MVIILHPVTPVKHYSLTTDLCTSRALHAYMSLTVHYLASIPCPYRVICLKQEFPDSHTEVNIMKKFFRSGTFPWTCCHYGSNVVLVADLTKRTGVHCFSHCLNLAFERPVTYLKLQKLNVIIL